MLTDLQIDENKTKYLNLLTKLEIDITEIAKYLEAIDYYNKPATTQAFKAYQGGLCEYALAFAHELGILANNYCPGEYTAKDILKVALIRDIYRAELFIQSGTCYKIVDAAERPTFGETGFSSYMIAKNFMDFTDEQILAIKYSSPRDNYAPDLNEIQRSYKLVALAKMADLAVSNLR